MASVETAVQGPDSGSQGMPPPTGPPPPRPRRRIRNYLLDRGLQLRYVLVVTLISSAISGFLGYCVWAQSRHASETILQTISAEDAQWLGPEASSQIVGRLQSSDHNLLILMVTVGIGLMAVLFAYLVVMTHKVAGPLFKLGGYLDQLAAGRLPKVAELRRGDQFHEFFDHFKAMNDSLRTAAAEDVAAIDRFLLACEAEGIGGGGELGHQLAELRALKKKKETALQ